MRRIWNMWSKFWIAFSWPAGLTIAVIVPNAYESYVHDVSFYDAVFVESWDKSGQTTQPPASPPSSRRFRKDSENKFPVFSLGKRQL
jgi:hypothetical protein